MSNDVHPVDEVLPLPKLFALGLQHVLVMYANAVAVPLILGGALHLPKEQIAMLINADLFACGIATLIQTIGIGPFGIRLIAPRTQSDRPAAPLGYLNPGRPLSWANPRLHHLCAY